MITAKWARAAVACTVSVGAVLTTASASADWTPGGPQFWVDAPSSMEIDPADGSLWVVDHSENAAYKFDADGDRVDSLGGFGMGPGQFNGFSGITVGPTGDVFGSDIGNHRIQRFTPDGEYAQSYGDAVRTPQPVGIAVAGDGTLYAGDIQTGLQAFALDGTPVNYLAGAVPRAFAVAIGHDGAVWVSQYVDQDHGDRVHKVDPATGAILVTINGFGQPTDIEVNPDGSVSVVNFNTSTIRTYESDGTFVEETAAMPGINQIAIDAYGRLYHYGHAGGGIIAMLPEPITTTSYIGPDNTPTVEAGFAAATAAQTKQFIDFDGDGFDHLAAHTYTAIAPDHYAAQGVTLLGLDARSVGTQRWANSPPIGAWQQGFNQHSAESYSFVLDEPVASFGLFLSDVEGPDPMVTVHLDDGRREFLAIPRSLGYGGARFAGVTAQGDVITRVDIDSFGDFHIIDDVQFGRIDAGDELAPTISIAAPLDGATFNLRQFVTASYACADNGGSGLTSCDGPVVSGGPVDTSAPGTFPFVVSATDGAGNTAQATTTYTVLPVPIFGVTVADPDRRAQGSGAVNVTVTGDGFLPGARARISGTGVSVVSTTVISATTLEVRVSVGGTAPLGSRDVTVTNTGGAAATCTACFTVNARPAVTVVAPGILPRGSAHATLEVTGSGFQPGASASFSGTGVTVHGAMTTDPARLTLDVSVDVGAATGGRTLTVVNPDGGTATKAAALTVRALPTITTATPNHVRQGQSASVVLNGAGFPIDFVTGGGTISFGQDISVGTVVRNSATRLTATIAVGPDAAAGQRTIRVVNPDGGAADCIGCLVVVADPSVAGAAPAALARGAVTQSVTVHGADFQPGATVRFSGAGVTVGTATVLDAATIVVPVSVTASSALGARDIVVTNPDTGTATCNGCFTVNPKPTIGTLSPNGRPRGSSDSTVQMSGTGFQPGAVVSTSGTGVVATVVSVTPTQITLSVTVAPGAVTGLRSVTVTNPDAGTVTKANAFRVT
jgi:quinohemoprotein amine dehydrogenase alpha subunit-like protein